MKILLINNNPVVSRLTALSARKEDIEIDEIQEVTELNSDTYDIVFVDGDSFSKDVSDVITENMKVKKSVLFYAEEDKDENSSFDITILKPFLPSEVSAVIRSVEELEEVSAEQEKIVEDFNLLENEKEEPRGELFTLDDDFDLEEKKEEAESSFDKKLEEAFPLKINDVEDDELFNLDMDEEKINLQEKSEKSENNKEKLDLALDEELFSPENKMEEKEELLEFDLEDKLLEEKEETKVNDELFTLDEEVVTPTTKILDESEIENIKGLLSEDNSSEMALEDLMTSAPLLEKVDEKEEVVVKAEKKKSKKLTKKVDDAAVMETLSSLPIESLRELLAGATVNIKIKFPKAK